MHKNYKVTDVGKQKMLFAPSIAAYLGRHHTCAGKSVWVEPAKNPKNPMFLT